jgi:hypothetical protein
VVKLTKPLFWKQFPATIVKSQSLTPFLCASLLSCGLISLADDPDNTLESIQIHPDPSARTFHLLYDERMDLKERDRVIEVRVSEDLQNWRTLNLNQLADGNFEVIRSHTSAKSDEYGPLMARSYVLSNPFVGDAFFQLHLRPLSERISYELIRLDDRWYPGIVQSWDNIGMDDAENVYFGFTTEISSNIEDMNLFRYNAASGTYDHLGTYISTLEAAGNYIAGESVPKGHTYMPFIGGKLYMGSQGFHDFKEALYEPGNNLNEMRGSHIFTWDLATEQLEDLSRNYPGGVATVNEGILCLSMVPYGDHLFGLTHPFGSIVFLNHTTGAIDKVVPGIPWSLGNPISREMVVTPNGNIYIYRGTEKPDRRHLSFNVYKYSIADDELTMLDFTCTGGFWSAQAITRDWEDIYIVTVQGELYHLDTTTETWSHWGKFLPAEMVARGGYIRQVYGVTLDYNEEHLYAIIVRGENGPQSGDLIEYNLATRTSQVVTNFGPGIYTGNNTRDSKGNIYFNRFGSTWAWQEDCGLLKIHIKSD